MKIREQSELVINRIELTSDQLAIVIQALNYCVYELSHVKYSDAITCAAILREINLCHEVRDNIKDQTK